MLEEEGIDGMWFERGLLLMEWNGVYGTVCDDTT